MARATYARPATMLYLDDIQGMLPVLLDHVVFRTFEALETYEAAIMPEITMMGEAREIDPTRHAQRSLVTAILSPGCELPVNIAMARNAMNYIDGKPIPDDIDEAYRHITKDGGCGRSTGGNIRALMHSMPYIRDMLTDDDMSKETLMALRKSRVLLGIGEKTASFAMALYDPTSPVYTIDVHMMRWLCRVAGRDDLVAGSMNIKDNAYRALEPILVALLQSHIDAPMLAMQWAAWNVESGKGEHRTHVDFVTI